MSDKEQAKQALREKAEEILRTTAQEAPITPAEMAPEEVRRLLHELRVHQIEMEMQNTELRRSQEELDGERRRYFDLYDLAPVGYCTVSEPGLILEANLSAINLLGVIRYTFIGRRMSRFILDEDQNIYYRHRKQLFETGEAQECDLRLVKPDGTSFWAHLKGTAAQGEEGAPVCRVVISDITERKKAEEALLQSKEHFRALFSSFSDPVLVADRDTGILTECNEAAERYFGRSREQLIGAPQRELHPPETLQFEGVTEDFKRVATNPGFPEDIMLLAAGGEVRCVEVSARSFEIEERRLILGVFRDVTERKRAEEALRESEKRFRSYFNLSLLGFAITSLEKGWIEVNERLCEIFGYPREELVTLTWTAITHPEDIERDVEQFNLVLEGVSEGYSLDKRFIRKDGSVIHGSISVRCVRKSDQTINYFVALVQDITDRKRAEEALRESEDLLNATQRLSKVGGWEWNLETHTMYWTEETYRIHELAPDEVGSKPEAHIHRSLECYEPEVRTVIKAAFQRCVEEGQPYDLEVPFTTVKGQRLWIRTIARPVVESGKVIRIIGNIMDITERKQAEEENRRFKTISDNAVYGKAIADLDGNLLYVNRFFANIHGYEPEQLIGKHLSLFHSRDQMEVVDGLNATMMREGYFTTTTLWHRHQDGREFPMLMNGNLIKDEYGKSQCLAVSAIDMSAHHLAEEALRESEERFRMLASESPVSIVAFDREGRVTFVSDWHLTKFAKGQLGPEFFLARKVWELPSLVSSGVAEKVQCILSGKSLYADEVHVPSNSIGEEAYQNMRGVPFRRDGAIVGGVLIREDITARKQAEADREKLQAQLQQAQKMEAIGTLAGGIAHDFNNILGAILGYAEMAQEDSPAGSTVRQDIDQVVKASHRAKELVKQILAFSRQAETKYIPLQPAFIIQEAIKMLRSSLPSTIDIKQHIDMDAGLILASPTQIHQIVMNLGTNAFHAMEETGGTLIISLLKKTLDERDIVGKPGVQPGDFVQLSIGDTGPGIAPEIREKIFEPYFTTKEVGKGTGMGLAIIHGIAKSYKGFVSCHSVLDEGTVFHVYLPVLSEPAALKALSSPSDFTQLGHERILFVDDEELLAEMGKVMLERLGYHVTVRRNSLEALNTFQNEPDQFDLVITDQTMPGMTGIDMARRMLQIRPGMPIILCTGYSSLISEDKAKSLGIKGFAMKPLAKKDIAVLIREVLDGKGTAMVDTKP